MPVQDILLIVHRLQGGTSFGRPSAQLLAARLDRCRRPFDHLDLPFDLDRHGLVARLQGVELPGALFRRLHVRLVRIVELALELLDRRVRRHSQHVNGLETSVPLRFPLGIESLNLGSGSRLVLRPDLVHRRLHVRHGGQMVVLDGGRLRVHVGPDAFDNGVPGMLLRQEARVEQAQDPVDLLRGPCSCRARLLFDGSVIAHHPPILQAQDLAGLQGVEEAHLLLVAELTGHQRSHQRSPSRGSSSVGDMLACLTLGSVHQQLVQLVTEDALVLGILLQLGQVLVNGSHRLQDRLRCYPGAFQRLAQLGTTATHLPPTTFKPCQTVGPDRVPRRITAEQSQSAHVRRAIENCTAPANQFYDNTADDGTTRQ